MSQDDPEETSIDFRGVPRVPVATVKTWHRLKTVELNRLKEALENELLARRVQPYGSGYPVVGYNATQADVDHAALREEIDRIQEQKDALTAESLRADSIAGQVGGLLGGLAPQMRGILKTAGMVDEAVEFDTQTGLDRAPTRYTAKGRETIDRMRDYTYQVAVASQADWWPIAPIAAKVQDVADMLFATFCCLQAMKYRDRHGLKEGVDPARDEKAAFFYEQMAAHVESGGKVPDPRHQRPDFQPYVRQEWTE